MAEALKPKTPFRDAMNRALEKMDSGFNRLFPLPQTLMLEPAYSSASSARPFISVEPEKADNAGIIRFNTGDLPKKGTPSRNIADWGNVGISPPGVKPEGSAVIGVEAAQDEVQKLRKAESACHEHIAFEAVKLCGDAEANQYALHIVTGAMAEDYAFMMGEKFDDLLAKPATKENMDRVVDSRVNNPPKLLEGLFVVISKLAKLFTGGSVEKDQLNRPYMCHFYNGAHGLRLIGGEIEFKSALERIVEYWRMASELYQNGEKARAFCALGHAVHLMCDMHVPAHTHNDVHGPGNLDSLERWLGKKDFVDLKRRKGDMNITIWDASSLTPPRHDPKWRYKNSAQKLTDLVVGVVTNTQRFRSVDAEGTDKDQGRTGNLSDQECFGQADILIPDAISNSAKLITEFLACNRKNR
ncbi:MAG: hypothetical protein ACP5NX_02910 [Candidatus Bilamarchaeaceae archaeon]